MRRSVRHIALQARLEEPVYWIARRLGSVSQEVLAVTRVQEMILRRKKGRAIGGRLIGSLAGIDRHFHGTAMQLDAKSDVPFRVYGPCFGAEWTLVAESGVGNVFVVVVVDYDKIDSDAAAAAAAQDCVGVVAVQCLGEIENSATSGRASPSGMGREGGNDERHLCPDVWSTLGLD